MSVAPTILIVDDDPAFREALEMTLSLDGYSSLAAEHGEAALELLSRSDPLPGVILLDLRMPVMDGVRFRELQKQNVLFARIPTVVLSADAAVDSF